MAGHNTNRFSTYTTASTDSRDGAEKKKDMWNSMLESVASGKRLPEKNLLVLGGTVESQRDFLEALSNNELRRSFERHGSKIPPIANHFALGYTYYDVLDADQEDILARISLYSLTKPSPSFGSLVKPLLTPQSIPNTLIVVLLDWSQPWLWMRQLREWILLLRTVLVSLSVEAKDAMEEVMLGWRDRGRGGGTNLDGSGAALPGEGAGDVALPLGPGEWEDALGLPLAVVCQNADKMEYLEKMHGWRDEEFDLVLQFLRTILLKHGASLIYTVPNTNTQLPSLIHSILGITSLLKRQPLKHNVIDRDKITVPPNWDSWGKIRVLREGFDVESVSDGWSIDLDQPFPRPPREPKARKNGAAANVDADAGRDDVLVGTGGDIGQNTDSENEEEEEEEEDDDEDGLEADQIEGSAVTLFEKTIEDPSNAALQVAGRGTHSTRLEVDTLETQPFLAQQLNVLEAFRVKREEEAKRAEAALKPGTSGAAGRRAGGATSPGPPSASGVVEGAAEDAEAVPGGVDKQVAEHIGPVQFNMGGIQVDADDMVQRLKERQAQGSSPPLSSLGDDDDDEPIEEDGEGGMKTDNLQTFFANLMNRRVPPKAAGS